MTYSEVKDLIKLAQDLNIDKTELFTEVDSENENFEVENYKFITHDEAVEEVSNTYQCDEYLLGCFNASFISDVTNIDFRVIEALQKAEAFSELGMLILDYLDKDLTELSKEYIRLDGYGNALNSYDGNWREITLNGIEYIYFRV